MLRFRANCSSGSEEIRSHWKKENYCGKKRSQQMLFEFWKDGDMQKKTEHRILQQLVLTMGWRRKKKWHSKVIASVMSDSRLQASGGQQCFSIWVYKVHGMMWGEQGDQERMNDVYETADMWLLSPCPSLFHSFSEKSALWLCVTSLTSQWCRHQTKTVMFWKVVSQSSTAWIHL